MLRCAYGPGTLEDYAVRLAGVVLYLAVRMDPPQRVHGPAPLAGPGRRRVALSGCPQCGVRPVRARQARYCSPERQTAGRGARRLGGAPTRVAP